MHVWLDGCLKPPVQRLMMGFILAIMIEAKVVPFSDSTFELAGIHVESSDEDGAEYLRETRRIPYVIRLPYMQVKGHPLRLGRLECCHDR